MTVGPTDPMPEPPFECGCGSRYYGTDAARGCCQGDGILVWAHEDTLVDLEAWR